jgi:Peptidase A4 family
VPVALALFAACAPAWAGSAAGAGGQRTHSPSARLSVGPATLTYRGGRPTLRWSTSHATRCTLSVEPRFWTRGNPTRDRCRGRVRLAVPATAFHQRWTFTLRARNAAGRTVVARKTLVVHAPPFAVSPNWSGYVVRSTAPVTAVSGRFTVPRLNCGHVKRASESTWVGTGGAGGSSGDLLQTGVRSDCVAGAQDRWYAWWDEFPETAEVDFPSMSVSTGDSMSASVARNPDGSWTTRLDDLSTGISGVMTTGSAYGTVLDSSPTAWLDEEGSSAGSYAGGRTAEWIVEAFQIVPLADFGSVAFSGLTTSLPSWKLTGDEALGLGDGFGSLYAAPSGPDSSQHGFSVTYTG